MNSEYVKNVMNAGFDWTFSSNYYGSTRHLLNPNSSLAKEDNLRDLFESDPPLTGLIEPETTEKINVEKLKRRSTILFYEEIDLFEDELADHGVAKCSVKIRVMPDCFFVLLRFFLRVDNVYVRFYDTRLYHEFGRDFMVRERGNHEANVADLVLPEETRQLLLTDPTMLYQYVPEKWSKVDKIKLPKERIS